MKNKRNKNKHVTKAPANKILEMIIVQPNSHSTLGNNTNQIVWTIPRVLSVTRTDSNRHRMLIDWSGGHPNGDTSYVQITRHGEDQFEWYDEQTDFLRQDMPLDFLLWDHELHRDERLKQTILLLEY